MICSVIIFFGLNHVQVNVSLAQLPAARDFYLNFMGMKEIERPRVFKSEGFWFHAGTATLSTAICAMF